MDRGARLPIDCPRCEDRGGINLDDDATLSCPLCNNWCMLCLAATRPMGALKPQHVG